MKILILSPIDEQHAIHSNLLTLAILKNLGEDAGVVYSMAGYADFLVQCKLADNWEQALIKSFITLEKVEKDNSKNHLIVIGNAPRADKFDLVVSYDDGIEKHNYEDKFLELVQEKGKKISEFFKFFNNVYNYKDSKLNMINKDATAKFISSYAKTERENDYSELIRKYEEYLKKHTFR